MNNVVLIGRLTKDVEIRKTTSGKSVTTFTLAVDRGRDAGTDYIQCTAYETVADNLERFCAKGNLVAVKGRIRVETKETQQGRRIYTDVVAEHIQYLEPKRKAQNTSQPAQQLPQEPKPAWNEEVSIGDDELPF